MQTKLKPIFLLMTLTAAAVLLYTSNDVRAQGQSIGFFDVSAFSPEVISISPRLGGHNENALDTAIMPLEKIRDANYPAKK